jgi:hypothetical protein
MPTLDACPKNELITGCAFAQYLLSQEPVYDKLILADIRPTDGWIGHVQTGTFPAYSGVTHTLDRFNHVWPDTTHPWVNLEDAYGSCLGTPCDKTEHSICWGVTRLTYHLEEQSWQTPLLCFDQMMHITHAKEHLRQIITDILRPATSAIQSMFIRKRALIQSINAGTAWYASAAMTPLTGVWQVDANGSECYWCCNAPPGSPPNSKLTPQMLQRRVNRLMLMGYFGKQPFKDSPPGIELVTDMETCWELDKLGGATPWAPNAPTLVGNWRFTEFDAANKYWRYGFSGAIGNYMVRVDPMQLRFKYVDAGGPAPNLYRYQLVIPYTNGPASSSQPPNTATSFAAGLRDNANAEFDTAQYSFTFIWHNRAMECLVADATPVNPEMPFSSRNFGGKWQWVMDNLGADCNGQPIENKRRNKGQFIADFKQAIRPLYTEFCEAIFHMREPACVHVVSPCNDQTATYPLQTYDSECHPCDCPPAMARNQ